VLFLVIFRKEQDQPAFKLAKSHAGITFRIVLSLFIRAGERRSLQGLEALRNRTHQALDMRTVTRLLYRPEVKINVVFLARDAQHLSAKLTALSMCRMPMVPQHGQSVDVTPRRDSQRSFGKIA
jgi:hypothetical protein